MYINRSGEMENLPVVLYKKTPKPHVQFIIIKKDFYSHEQIFSLFIRISSYNNIIIGLVCSVGLSWLLHKNYNLFWISERDLAFVAVSTLIFASILTIMLGLFRCTAFGQKGKTVIIVLFGFVINGFIVSCGMLNLLDIERNFGTVQTSMLSTIIQENYDRSWQAVFKDYECCGLDEAEIMHTYNSSKNKKNLVEPISALKSNIPLQRPQPWDKPHSQFNTQYCKNSQHVDCEFLVVNTLRHSIALSKLYGSLLIPAIAISLLISLMNVTCFADAQPFRITFGH